MVGFEPKLLTNSILLKSKKITRELRTHKKSLRINILRLFLFLVTLTVQNSNLLLEDLKHLNVFF